MVNFWPYTFFSMTCKYKTKYVPLGLYLEITNYVNTTSSTSAKFLWKRIPDEVKEENGELSIIWTVGKMMWKKNYAEIYRVINSCPTWPNHLKNIMNLIFESTRERVTNLILRAYSSISIADASRLLGLSLEDTLSLANKLNWTYEEQTGYLLIKKEGATSKDSSNNAVLGLDNGAELLDKLTDYIMFLEVAR